MQIICIVEGSSDDYFSEGKQRLIRPLNSCPHCGVLRPVRALGYYERDISRPAAKGLLRILIRRFRCMACGKTVSMLPSFAQPYRVVLNATIQASFSGEIFRSDVEAWKSHLRRYWDRFCFWLPSLHPTVRGIGLSPPATDATACWESLVGWAGSFSEATIGLTRGFQLTVFGRYRCHSPNRCDSEI